MTPTLLQSLTLLEDNPQLLKGIRRGVEREGLRINAHGSLAQTSHPESFGSSLSHKWITTDFAEALLEFITPVDDNIGHMLTLLRDIHRYVARHLIDERLWPMSMPCCINNTHDIVLAQYGNSNLGRIKMVYREGLKNRYSALMQMISGVHYNFSFPLSFWQAYAGISDEVQGKEVISDGYLGLIRNYYRFGWIIPYLFGASPGMFSSFLKGRKTDLPFKHTSSGLIYLPYATSLRLSDLGYKNKLQRKLYITFNYLDEYVRGLKEAMTTPFPDYERIGLKRDGHYLQLNTNVLQNENELYALIRPKRVAGHQESPSDALIRGGIEYVEVRALDINPFSPVGIDKDQVLFLDLFLIWCTLDASPKMNSSELFCTHNNWNRVILEGRKPGLLLGINCGNREQKLKILGKSLFSDLRCIAETLDRHNDNELYQKVCDKLIESFDYPELTLSARFLNQLIKNGINGVGLMLANNYYYLLRNEQLEVLSDTQFLTECRRSHQRQYDLEASDILSFDEFLAIKNCR